jgi:hypothetical protein
MKRVLIIAVWLATALCAAPDARSVSLNPEGRGQALIYPYYTVRATTGNPFNTYITVVNHDTRAKAIRVRFREGRMGHEVGSFNLYLSPSDVWAGAIVPTQFGARVITRDRSCTSPSLFPPDTPTGPVDTGELQFNDFAYSGTNNDGLGEGPDREREGYVEMIEMATLTGDSAVAVTHASSGVPPGCFQAASTTFAPSVGPPTGNLSGTATLINVASGMDFTFNAEALDALATAPYYRNIGDPYPDFDAAEVTPISDITWQGNQYRLVWSRGIDAVSSVLMRFQVFNEIVRDSATQSATDWVLTFPTRRFYVTPTTADLPFSRANNANCEDLGILSANREELRAVQTGVCQPDLGCGARLRTCFTSNVITMRDSSVTSPTPVLGSFNINEGPPPVAASQIVSGWGMTVFVGSGPSAGLKSLPVTTIRDMRNDTLSAGEMVVRGLPVVGFMARTFLNGTLTCGSITCQGNYGGSFAHRYKRFINAPSP